MVPSSNNPLQYRCPPLLAVVLLLSRSPSLSSRLFSCTHSLATVAVVSASTTDCYCYPLPARPPVPGLAFVAAKSLLAALLLSIHSTAPSIFLLAPSRQQQQRQLHFTPQLPSPLPLTAASASQLSPNHSLHLLWISSACLGGWELVVLLRSGWTPSFRTPIKRLDPVLCHAATAARRKKMPAE
jgi:hypothetical protein